MEIELDRKTTEPGFCGACSRRRADPQRM